MWRYSYYVWFWAVLFNVYGPRAQSDDLERIEFKLKFYKILQVKEILDYWMTYVSFIYYS